ncbi:oviduct-specific glycoprotein-like isoform X1 [Dreissena polymorpha]|uniref:oviduct-specific glycoprotein-like isoform X1 n=2 Tax=Dreissena polymorpha TaxID=45954 RepID=UPI0022645766|nr:oviduct-specific glycoprotein-like isoform X1 [Dreissena polymorpha]
MSSIYWVCQTCDALCVVTNFSNYVFLCAFIPPTQGLECFRVVCSYTNWAQYRPGDGRFLPEDVDPSLCTHLIYVYAKLKGNKLEPAEWNDESTTWSEGMYQRVINLKDLNPEMKVLLGVGGWQMGSTDFSRMSMSQGSRRAFARSTVKFLRDRKFDGLSIDWQHPTKRGGRPKDKENFSLLLQDLRLAFDNEGQMTGKPSLMLSAGVSASKEVIDTAYEHNNITKYVDFLNVFAFDLHGDWDNYTGHPSQLYARKEEFGPATEVNVDAVMRYWMSLVPDVTKLVLGVSTYGRTFTLRRARHTEYNVPTVGPGVEGEYTRQPGMLAYYERCLQYVDAPRVWDPVSQVPYWHSGDQWIAGEDTDSIRAKVNWTRTYQIGGMLIWSLDTDDVKNQCSEGAFPLLKTAVSALRIPLDKNATRPFIPRAEPRTVTTPAKVEEAPYTVDYFATGDSGAVVDTVPIATTPAPKRRPATTKTTTSTSTTATTTTQATTSTSTTSTTTAQTTTTSTTATTTTQATTSTSTSPTTTAQTTTSASTSPTTTTKATIPTSATHTTTTQATTFTTGITTTMATTSTSTAATATTSTTTSRPRVSEDGVQPKKQPVPPRLTREQQIKLNQERRRKIMQNRQNKTTSPTVTHNVISTPQTTTPSTIVTQTTMIISTSNTKTQSTPEPKQNQPKPNDKRVNDPAEIQKRRQRIMVMRRQRMQESRRKSMQNRQNKTTSPTVTQNVISTPQTTTPSTIVTQTTMKISTSTTTTQSTPEPKQNQPKPNDKRVNDPAEIQKRRQRIMVMRRQRMQQNQQTTHAYPTSSPTTAATPAPTASKITIAKVTIEPTKPTTQTPAVPKENGDKPNRRQLSPLQIQRVQQRQRQLKQQKQQQQNQTS